MTGTRKTVKKIAPLSILLLLIILCISLYQIVFKDTDFEHTLLGELSTPAALSSQPAVQPTLPADLLAPPASSPLSAATRTAAPAQAQVSQPPAADFDFYVLALSWSPDYCATDGEDDPQQCSLGKKLAFVLHGLWPQYDRGYPSDCTGEKLPTQVKDQFPNLYPSPKLYTHEWEKHGTCTGLAPLDYLALSKQIKESVNIPPAFRSPEQPFRLSAAQLKEQFVSANPGYSPDTLAVFCSGSGRFLKEIYVCFSLGAAPTACSREIHSTAAKSCRQKDFLVRNVR